MTATAATHEADFALTRDAGPFSTVYRLWPQSVAAWEWAIDHLPEDGLWAGSYVIEHRFVEDIVQGIAEGGLEVCVDGP